MLATTVVHVEAGSDDGGSQQCGVSRSVVSPLQAARTWEMSLGHPPYLRPKGQRNQSMVGKQEAAEGVYVADLQGPNVAKGEESAK